jgi:hypothetical protein
MIGATLLASTGAAADFAPPAEALRPPAVPLIVHDPYFSVWSFSDRLADDDPRHWTGTVDSLCSMIRIDGKPYRLMGAEPRDIPPMPQVGLKVWPTRTIYEFRNAEVSLTLTFLTPALPQYLDVLSRPVTYITWQVRAADGRTHVVSIYDDSTSGLVVNRPEQAVIWSRKNVPGLQVLQVGSKEQPILQKKGDNLRIDWGYLYSAAPRSRELHESMASAQTSRTAFARGEPLPTDDLRMPRAANDDLPALSFTFDPGSVGAAPVSRMVMLAYDDLYSIAYFHHRLRPYWRRHGADAAALLRSAARDYPRLSKRCQAFDQELMADLVREGGERYAALCALAYRQCLGANKLVADDHEQPLLFPKENFSNGCIGTVDVIYPMEPLFLLMSPTLTKASLTPLLDYASSPHWRFPFAPHDLGTYPQANGQVYGGGERSEENQMPVEESGNLLLLVAGLARAEGNAGFADKYWPVLTRWAAYLKANGLDPERQLCTDDFAGHLAHNVNLSAKAIEALGAYSLLCGMRGDTARAAEFRNLAQSFAHQWTQTADDGDHYRLAFDKPGTWSQKYNLVWDRILDLHLFPEAAIRKEAAFYQKELNKYGLPLDNRRSYTKLDWCAWSASLADSPNEFQTLISPLYDFLNQTPDRVPMTDWFMTTTARKVGFQARSVVGGVYIKLLSDGPTWKKWAGRDPDTAANWAPLPQEPTYTALVPTAQSGPIPWRYTLSQPAASWFQPGFDDTTWSEGPAGFGTRGTPGSVVRTEWSTGDIWLRRQFTLTSAPLKDPQLLMHHDEDAEVYLNGVLAARIPGYTTDYDVIDLAPEARGMIKPGTNLLAVHCHQTTGGQYIDVGLVVPSLPHE